MIGVTYAVLSLAAITLWLFDPQTFCTSKACSAITSFLNRSWYLWGAVFYAVAAELILSIRKNILTGAYLVAGTVFHAGLIAYGYITTGSICPVCWKLAVVDALLAVGYIVSPGRKEKVSELMSFGPVRSIAILSMVLLVVNPVHEETTVSGKALQTKVEESIKEEVKIEELQDQISLVRSLKAQEAEANPCYLRVQEPGGAVICLDLREKPALLFAVWCFHCSEVLKEVAELELEKRPYVVVTYLRGGDEEAAGAKLAECGLEGCPFYLMKSPPEIVEGVPALVWWDGKMKSVEGAGAVVERLHIPKLLGRAEIPNPPGGGAVNAELAASLINGTIVQPGEVFSFNRTVGPRTTSRGFVIGSSIVRNVYGGYEVGPDVGGGVCRTATALHLAVRNAGLEVVEHHCHSLPVSYAKPGDDAAVAYGVWDYKFRNNTERRVKVKLCTEKEKISVELRQLRREDNDGTQKSCLTRKSAESEN